MKKLMLAMLGFVIILANVVWAQVDIQSADKLFERYKYNQAVSAYEQLYAMNQNDYELTWKYCRALVDAGEMTHDKDKQKEMYAMAAELADKAISLDSSGWEGHLYAAVAYGRKALAAGAKERVKLSKMIRKEAEKTIELNPESDIAYHVLARWHKKITSLSWIEKKFANIFLGGIPSDASKEKAVENFKKAIELNPEYINHYVQLGLTYKEMKEYEEARTAFKKALDLKAKSPRDKKYQEEARKALEKIKNKK